MESKGSNKKIALVTGASRGLGRAVAIRLATCNIRVVINYLSNDDEANKVIREIESLGGKAMLYKADVSDATAVRKMTRQIWEVDC